MDTVIERVGCLKDDTKQVFGDVVNARYIGRGMYHYESSPRNDGCYEV